MIGLDGFEVHAEQRFYQDQICLYIGAHRNDRTQIVMPWVPVIETHLSEGSAVTNEPTITMSRAQATAMMAAFWRAGVRPPGIANEGDVVNHLQAHIADLREQVKQSHIVIRELNSILAERVMPDHHDDIVRERLGTIRA
jgi:hypothetical protein